MDCSAVKADFILYHSLCLPDHSVNCGVSLVQIDYPSFNRNFYEEHEEISSLTKMEVIELKKKMGIKVGVLSLLSRSRLSVA